MEKLKKKREEEIRFQKAEAKEKKRKAKLAERQAKAKKGSSSTVPGVPLQTAADDTPQSTMTFDQPAETAPILSLSARSAEDDYVHAISTRTQIWLDPSFESTETIFEKCIWPVLENEMLVGAYGQRIREFIAHNNRVQNAMREYSLSPVEASCIIIYTMELRDAILDPMYSLSRSFYRVYNESLSNRDHQKIRKFADYSYHLNCGLQKMPPICKAGEGPVTLYRGLDRFSIFSLLH